MSDYVKILVHPEGRKCAVIVNGEDVSSIVSRLIIDADVSGSTSVYLLGPEVNRDGIFYAKEGPDGRELAEQLVILRDVELEADGHAEIVTGERAAQLLVEASKRYQENKRRAMKKTDGAEPSQAE